MFYFPTHRLWSVQVMLLLFHPCQGCVSLSDPRTRMTPELLMLNFLYQGKLLVSTSCRKPSYKQGWQDLHPQPPVLETVALLLSYTLKGNNQARYGIPLTPRPGLAPGTFRLTAGRSTLELARMEVRGNAPLPEACKATVLLLSPNPRT